MPAAAALPYIMFAMQAVNMLTSKKGGDSQPAIQAPTAPPQAAKAPEQAVFKSALAGGDPTALTGAGGVSNDSLTLGKSTVLGA